MATAGDFPRPVGCRLDNEWAPLFAASLSTTRFITGTGLGLPIVKGLVEALKGRISVDSVPDKGTTVTVLLPVD